MAVRDVQAPRFRAEEKTKKAGVTLADLYELVDKAREAGLNPETVVLADYYVLGTPKGRNGNVLKWLEA